MAAPGQLNLGEYPPLGARTIDCFEKLEQIGEGTYGNFSQVYRARETRTGEITALKKIRMDNEKEGLPITAIREIKILKKLHHENVIQLKEIVTSPGTEKDEEGKPDCNKYKGSIYMVFEYMDHDLAGLLDRSGMQFTVPQIKCYMKQLLMGIYYCHVNQVLHRDIKGSNLLINNKGDLKLADFGLARSFCKDSKAKFTNRVITLWYRPPELLLGSTEYGKPVDIWSVGCIFAELLNGKPIFPGKSEAEQIAKIYELCGTADESNWPDVSKLAYYFNFKPKRPMKRRVREAFRHLDRHALDLLDRMLTLDPIKRITAEAALDADYFWTEPLPCDPRSLPRYESSHEFHTKKRRQQLRMQEEMVKRHKTQHPQPHSHQLPIQQQPAAPVHPIRGAPLPLHAGPSYPYEVPHGPPQRPSRYPEAQHMSVGYGASHGGQGSSYNAGLYAPQGPGAPYPGTSMPGMSGGPRAVGGGRHGGGAPPLYGQGDPYGVPGASHAPNMMGGNRSRQYG